MSIGLLLAVLLAPFALLWLTPLVSELASYVTRPRPARAVNAPAPRARLLFLIPAHDERLLIGECVRSLMAMSSARADSDVVVIADNCADETAALARAGGASVLERHDRSSPGKPRAIAWALASLPVARYDAVVIVDADSVVVPGFADELAARGPLRDIAVQGYFGVTNERDSWLSELGGLLITVRYEYQYPLKQRAGLNCPLTGCGMCLGTALLARSGWADSLTENWELYARYTALGERIDYAPLALVASQEASTLAASGTQRRRWQAGRRGVFLAYAGRIVRSTRIGWHQKLDAIAELAVPGPVLHTTLAVGAAMLLLGAGGRAAHLVAAAFALSLLPMVAWTTRAVARHSNSGRIILALARLPFYAMWRVVMAGLSVTTGRRGEWQRSPR